MRGKYFYKEVFLRASLSLRASVIHCVSMYPVYICIFLHESADDNITIVMLRRSNSGTKQTIVERTYSNGLLDWLVKYYPHSDTPWGSVVWTAKWTLPCSRSLGLLEMGSGEPVGRRTFISWELSKDTNGEMNKNKICNKSLRTFHGCGGMTCGCCLRRCQ